MHLRRHRRYVDSPSPRTESEVTVDVGRGELVDPLDEQLPATVDGAETENSVDEQLEETVRAVEESEDPDEVPASHRRIRRNLSLFTRLAFFFLRLLCKVGLVRR
jgi:hypothetical protein